MKNPFFQVQLNVTTTREVSKRVNVSSYPSLPRKKVVSIIVVGSYYTSEVKTRLFSFPDQGLGLPRCRGGGAVCVVGWTGVEDAEMLVSGGVMREGRKECNKNVV